MVQEFLQKVAFIPPSFAMLCIPHKESLAITGIQTAFKLAGRPTNSITKIEEINESNSSNSRQEALAVVSIARHVVV